MDKKKPVATVLSIAFASLSLIQSLIWGWDSLTIFTGIGKLPMWIQYWFVAPGAVFMFNLPCVVIALICIIVGYVRERRKRTLLISALMLIPGILLFIYTFLLVIAFGRM